MKYNRIREVLEKKGVSEIELSESVGKKRQTINSICLNKSQPRIPLLFEIAKSLKVKPATLLGDGSEITDDKKAIKEDE